MRECYFLLLLCFRRSRSGAMPFSLGLWVLLVSRHAFLRSMAHERVYRVTVPRGTSLFGVDVRLGKGFDERGVYEAVQGMSPIARSVSYSPFTVHSVLLLFVSAFGALGRAGWQHSE